MRIVRNTTKEKLKKGELTIGFGLRQARTVDIAKIIESCGYDWLSIDMEHNTMGIDTATQICVAALDAGITPLVRVPGHESFHASRVLDGGAMGIIVPHVNTPDQARRVVEICKYPPVGHRSLAGRLPQLGYQRLPAQDALQILNENTLVVVMLETPEAIDNADAIASVDGVDVLHIGTNDLMAEMSIPGQFNHEKVAAAYVKTICATRAHGKDTGIGGISDNTLVAKFVRKGARFLMGALELDLLMTAARSRAEFLRTIPLA